MTASVAPSQLCLLYTVGLHLNCLMGRSEAGSRRLCLLVSYPLLTWAQDAGHRGWAERVSLGLPLSLTFHPVLRRPRAGVTRNHSAGAGSTAAGRPPAVSRRGRGRAGGA